MTYHEVTNRLIEMSEADQKIHRDPHADRTEMANLDRANFEELQKIVEEVGWPTVSKVGQDAAGAAWLIVQHSINNVEADKHYSVQKKYLTMMKASLDDINPKHVALLEDRIMYSQHGVQLYGTQTEIVRENGTVSLRPLPLKYPERVEMLRRELGMNTLEEQMAYSYDLYKKLGFFDKR